MMSTSRARPRTFWLLTSLLRSVAAWLFVGSSSVTAASSGHRELEGSAGLAALK